MVISVEKSIFSTHSLCSAGTKNTLLHTDDHELFYVLIIYTLLHYTLSRISQIFPDHYCGEDRFCNAFSQIG